MNTLAPSQLENIEAELRRRRHALLARIREHLHGSDDPKKLSLANHLDATGDWVEADVFSENEIAMINHELAELKEVEAALKRIGDNSYGVCMNCGDDIDARRLDAQPTARSCVPCLEAFEKSHGIRRHAEI